MFVQNRVRLFFELADLYYVFFHFFIAIVAWFVFFYDSVCFRKDSCFFLLLFTIMNVVMFTLIFGKKTLLFLVFHHFLIFSKDFYFFDCFTSLFCFHYLLFLIAWRDKYVFIVHCLLFFFWRYWKQNSDVKMFFSVIICE